ncbi:Phosphoglycerate kinase [Ananas comosus]|uniref:Phosphoglycerate kinase n=1 Tax=Ananas comosus TaxID=4615 RepID=A0A199V4A3_ANACO|nr:Phosphoglycerate kinase [Ananas comosus]
MLHTLNFPDQSHSKFVKLTSCLQYNYAAGSQDTDYDNIRLNSLFHVQTLRNFPVEKLSGEVVLVRLDSTVLLESLPSDSRSLSLNRTLATIKHLHNAGAKVLLISNWGQSADPMISSEFLADYLSSLLQLKVVPASGVSNFMEANAGELQYADIFLLDDLAKHREEVSNCLEFSKKLSSGATIFVNDAFSLSHKILASTVGVARFCHASIAGFCFEEELNQLLTIIDTSRRPYYAIIGGSNFSRKSAALHHLASKCDGLVFVGKLAFQVMKALGLPVPAFCVEQNAVGEALKLIKLAESRKIPMYYPDDFWCLSDSSTKPLEIVRSDEIVSGWTPVDLGPSSLKRISSLISGCKKILWVGSSDCGLLKRNTVGASELAQMLETTRKSGCDVIVVGGAACKALAGISTSSPHYTMFHSASVVWEFLKGRTLPGVAALDKTTGNCFEHPAAYPHDIKWNTIFSDPTRPLVVDIGSGNGLFLFEMARRWKYSNFLGLEINEKLVTRCLDYVLQCNLKNVHFISANATSTFRSIVSSYPGDLVLVAIQCPNPDFNKEEHRWRMVQRILVEAIIDLLVTSGKSDVEAVAIRMKEQFILYGKGEVSVDGGDGTEWIDENPLGVRSDWERHVIGRGAPMYRTILIKA